MTPRQLKALEVFDQFGTHRERADEMGITERNYIYLLKRARKAQSRSEQLDPEAAAVMQRQGFQAPEQIHSAWIKKTDPDTGEAVSAYYLLGKEDPESVAEVILDALQSVEATPNITRAPDDASDDLLNLIPVTDAHTGMMSWAKETGEDYDLQIARDDHIKATNDIVSRLPKAGRAVVLNCGDHTHSNDGKNQTPASGHILDMDGRYAKVLMTAVQIEIDRIEIAKGRNEHVVYRLVPGNHDPEMSFAVSLSIAHHYRTDPRVTVDLNPAHWWFHQFGITLLAAVHGHQMKPDKMKGYLADAVPDLWGQTKFRHVFYGHYHRVHTIQDGSTMVECLGTAATRDAYAAPRFPGWRQMQGMTYHKTRGLVSRITYHHALEAA